MEGRRDGVDEMRRRLTGIMASAACLVVETITEQLPKG
jgi:hypothetical protein